MNIKGIQKTFRKNALNITAKCNLKTTLLFVDYLDVNLINCIHKKLFKLSSEENGFIQAAPVCQEALKQAGYNHKLSYKNKNKDSNNNNKNKDNFNKNDSKNGNNNNYN